VNSWYKVSLVVGVGMRQFQVENVWSEMSPS